ncbi:MAG: DNA replication/repair protein RecF [Deferrisomatales bacterium]
MTLTRIRVQGFRNLARVELPLDGRVNVLHGDNAQGKTNFIEAVYLLANLQSFRTRRLRDLIQSGQVQALLQGYVEGRNGGARLDVVVEPRGRLVRRNGKTPESTASYLSELHTVLFSPLDLELARGSQDQRRKFLDRATFLRDPSHLARLRSYNRVLKQRNAVLRRGGAQLGVWDERFAEWGAEVMRAREETLDRVGPIVAEMHREIAGGGEAIELHCPLPFGGPGELRSGLLEALERRRERDERLGYTTVGPHRAEVVVALNGQRAERHASQGQLRTLALAFKLALLRWGEQVTGELPVFLLDDPGSELDGSRLSYLGRFLASWPGQVIIAGTHPESVPLPAGVPRRRFRVHRGEVAPD